MGDIVVAGHDAEARPAHGPRARHARQVARGLLDRDDVLVIACQDGEVFHCQLTPGPAWDHVRDNSQFGQRLGHRAVIVDAQLKAGWPIVVAVHQQQPFRAGLSRVFGPADGLVGRIAAHSRQRVAFALGQLDALVNHPVVLVPTQGRRFAGRAAGQNAGDALLDLERYVAFVRRKIDLAGLVERRHKSGPRAFHFFQSHRTSSVKLTILGLPARRSTILTDSGTVSKVHSRRIPVPRIRERWPAAEGFRCLIRRRMSGRIPTSWGQPMRAPR